MTFTQVAIANPTATAGTVSTGGPGNTGFDTVAVDTSHFTNDTVNGKFALDFAPATNAVSGTWGSGTVGTITTDYWWCTDFSAAAYSTAGAKRFVQFKDSSGAQVCAVSFSSIASGASRCVIRNNANTATYTSTPTVFATGTWGRIEVHVNITAGTVSVDYFTNDSDTVAAFSTGNQTITLGANIQSVTTGMIDTSGIAIGMRNTRIGTGTAPGPFTSGSSSSVAMAQTSAMGVTGRIDPVSAVPMVQTSGMGVNTSTSSTGSPTMAQTSTMGVTGSITTPATVLMAQTSSMGVVPVSPITKWLALPAHNRVVAHRGGDNDWPEMTRFAFLQSALQGVTAFNVDVVWTSDGVPVASHDLTSNRVFSQTGVTFSAVTWASISGYTTITGGYPIERVDDLMDYIVTICPDAVFFVENKVGGSVRTAFNAMLAARNNPGGRNVYKAYYQDTGLASAVSAGAVGSGWGYWFAADSAAITSGNTLPWPILGEDYTGSSGDWTTMLGLAATQSKIVLGHVITSIANATTAYGLGAQGLMSGKILGVFPGSTVAMSQTSSMGVVGQVSRTSAVTMGQTSTMGVGTLITRFATVAMGQASTMTVGTLITFNSSVTMAQTSAMGVQASGASSSAVAMGQTSSMGVVGQQVYLSAVSMVQASTMSTAGVLTRFATVTMGQTSTMSTAGVLTYLATVAMSQTSAMGVATSGSQTSAVAMVGTSTMTVTGKLTYIASVGMAQSSLMGVSLAAPAVPPIVVTGTATPLVTVTGSSGTGTSVTGAASPLVTVTAS